MYKTYDHLVAISSTIPLNVSLVALKSAPPGSKPHAQTNPARISPVDELSKLGWRVNPAGVRGIVQFNDNYNHLSMTKSLVYFCEMGLTVVLGDRR